MILVLASDFNIWISVVVMCVPWFSHQFLFVLAQEHGMSVCSKLCYAIGGAPNQVAGSAASFFLQIYLLDIAHVSSIGDPYKL